MPTQITLTHPHTRKPTVYVAEKFDTPAGLADIVTAQYGLTGPRGATFFFQILTDGRGRTISSTARVVVYVAADIAIA